MPKQSSRADVEADTASLSDTEQNKLNSTFRRQLKDLRTLNTETFNEFLRQYRGEITTAAQVAKAQLQGSFDGMNPDSNQFGLTPISPGYFGYDSWDDMPQLTGGAVNDWIDGHSPTNLASGSANNSFGDPLRIGEPVVHVIIGIGSYADDPVTTRVQWEKNNEPEGSVYTEPAFRNTDLRIQPLDTAIILAENDQFGARVMCGGEVGTNFEDALYLVGVTFIETDELRNLDAADFQGNDTSSVVTTS